MTVGTVIWRVDALPHVGHSAPGLSLKPCIRSKTWPSSAHL